MHHYASMLKTQGDSVVATCQSQGNHAYPDSLPIWGHHLEKGRQAVPSIDENKLRGLRVAV